MAGGGFGALDFMNKTLKNNRGLIKKIKVFERIKPYNSALKNSKVVEINDTSTPQVLEQIKAQTLADDKRHSIFQILKLVAALIIIGLILFFLIGGVIEGNIH